MKNKILAVLVIFLLGTIIICNYNNVSDSDTLGLLSPTATIDLAVPEPSGLYYDKVSNTLWTVSDENSTIYNIDFSGEILNTIVVDGIDLEGITMMNDSTIVTILERDRTIVFLNKSGKELKRVKIELNSDPNKGLEGISFNPANSHFFILNEKDPGMLLEVDTLGNIIEQNNLDYSSDYSGLFYVESKEELWIISDEGEAVFKCSQDGAIMEKYNIGIEQIEGIAIDSENSILFVVSDPLEKLFIYSLP
jgi:uncharacterized protein YjiK